MKLQPLNDKVLILPAAAETKTPGGIIIPGNVENKPTRGTVIEVGPKVNPNVGDPFLTTLAVLPGTEVMFPLYGGVEVEIDGVKHRLLSVEEILGVLVPDAV